MLRSQRSAKLSFCESKQNQQLLDLSSPTLWRAYVSLISREKKGVAGKIGSYMTDIQKFKIEGRETAKDILYRVPQISLNCSKYHCKFNWVLFNLDVNNDLISSLTKSRKHFFHGVWL